MLCIQYKNRYDNLVKKKKWYGPLRTKLEPFLANFEPYEKELHQHHFQRMVLYLSHKLRCYTGISGPKKSRNDTCEKMSYFSFFFFFFFTCVDIANQLLTRHSPLAPLGQVDE